MEEYNKEIDISEKEIKKGDVISHSELLKSLDKP